MAQMAENEQNLLPVDCMDLEGYDPDLYEKLIRYATDAIFILDLAIREILEGLNLRTPDGYQLQVRPFAGRTAQYTLNVANRHIWQSNNVPSRFSDLTTPLLPARSRAPSTCGSPRRCATSTPPTSSRSSASRAWSRAPRASSPR